MQSGKGSFHYIPLPRIMVYPHSTHTHSPLDGLAIDSSGHRVLYCLIMGSWGADILANFLNKSLYYSSPFSITDSVYFFSECKEPNYTVPIVLQSSNSICPNITFYCCVYTELLLVLLLWCSVHTNCDHTEPVSGLLPSVCLCEHYHSSPGSPSGTTLHLSPVG